MFTRALRNRDAVLACFISSYVLSFPSFIPSPTRLLVTTKCGVLHRHAWWRECSEPTSCGQGLGAAIAQSQVSRWEAVGAVSQPLSERESWWKCSPTRRDMKIVEQTDAVLQSSPHFQVLSAPIPYPSSCFTLVAVRVITVPEQSTRVALVAATSYMIACMSYCIDCGSISTL